MAEKNEVLVLNDEEVQQFMQKNKAPNTIKITKSDMNVWYRWCASMNERQKVEDVCKKTTTLLHLLSKREVYQVYDKSLITLVSSEMLRDIHSPLVVKYLMLT